MIRAQILLRLHEGMNAVETTQVVPCSVSTVNRVRRRYLKDGWKEAIHDAPIPGRPKALTESDEKKLVALACSSPPQGRARWTIRLLAKSSGYTFSVVQRVLKEDGQKPWREKNVVCSKTG
jgi:transposase